MRLIQHNTDWLQKAKELSILSFWNEINNLRDSSISVIIYFAKICLVSDHSTTALEGFHSSVTRLVGDKNRTSSGDEWIENLLRVKQNGPPSDKFKGNSCLHAFTVYLGHALVTYAYVDDKLAQRRAKDRARQQLRYKRMRTQILQTKKLKLAASKQKSIKARGIIASSVVRPSLPKSLSRRRSAAPLSIPDGKIVSDDTSVASITPTARPHRPRPTQRRLRQDRARERRKKLCWKI